MVILAAVSVSAAINGNLLGLAGKAAEDYQKQEEYESKMLGNWANFAEDTMKNLEEGAGREDGGDDDEENQPPNGAQKTFTADTATPTEYGVYVDYPKDIDGNGTDEANTDYDDWQVFYVGQESDGEANGRIFLKAANYVKNEKITFAEQAGMTTDGDYSVYWKKENVPTTLQDTTHKSLFMYGIGRDYTLTESYISSRCVSALLNTGNWTNFVNDQYADYAIGGPTLSMWVASWNAKGYKKIYFNNTDEYGYYCGTTNEPDGYTVGVSSDEDGYNDQMYYPDHSRLGVGSEGCISYWLSAPGRNSGERHL